MSILSLICSVVLIGLIVFLIGICIGKIQIIYERTKKWYPGASFPMHVYYTMRHICPNKNEILGLTLFIIVFMLCCVMLIHNKN